MRSDMLSKRLRTVADMVTRGNRVCDVGCDHGYVSIYLVKQGISPGVLAMDVREGPIGAAREHVTEEKLEEWIEIRLSDGLHNYNNGEAQSLICAGMGGRLMRRILEEDKEKTDSFRELILQPQSEIEQFRCFLRESGYLIRDEEILEEDGKFYQVIRAVPMGSRKICEEKGAGAREICYDEEANGGEGCNGEITGGRGGWIRNGAVLLEKELCKLEDRYGPVNLLKKTDVFLSYLAREEKIYGDILVSLQENGLTDEKRRKRYVEIEKLLHECRSVRSILA